MKITDRKGAILGIVLIYMLIMTILGYGFLQLGYANIFQTDNAARSNRAFWLADAGITQVLYKLATDSTYRDNPTGFSGSGGIVDQENTYTVTANISSDPYVFTSRGTASRTNRSIAYSIPQALYYAIYAGKHVLQPEDATITGGWVDQQGDDNMPIIDYSYYEDVSKMAGNHYVSGNQIFNAGTYSGLWYVTGTATIYSNVTINGSIITEGSIEIKKSGTVPPSNINITAISPYPAIVSQNRFDCDNQASDIHVIGVTYVGADQGQALLQGIENSTFEGTIITKGQVNFQSTSGVTVTYNPSVIYDPIPGLSFPGVSGSRYWHEVSSS